MFFRIETHSLKSCVCVCACMLCVYVVCVVNVVHVCCVYMCVSMLCVCARTRVNEVPPALPDILVLSAPGRECQPEPCSHQTGRGRGRGRGRPLRSQGQRRVAKRPPASAGPAGHGPCPVSGRRPASCPSVHRALVPPPPGTPPRGAEETACRRRVRVSGQAVQRGWEELAPRDVLVGPGLPRLPASGHRGPPCLWKGRAPPSQAWRLREGRPGGGTGPEGPRASAVSRRPGGGGIDVHHPHCVPGP